MPPSPRKHYDAVVIGGGHNGLVAAAYLARAGQSVLVLERGVELGGATASRRVFRGVDARLSRYSYLVSLLPRQIVSDLALSFSTRQRAIASCTPYQCDGAARALLLSNVDDAASRVSFSDLTSDADWQGYQHLLALESAFAAKVWPGLLQPLRSREAWSAAFTTDLEREAWHAFVERPLGETLEDLIQDDLLRGLLFTDAKIGIFTHPHDPSLLQNRCFITHTIGDGTGEWRVPVGGMGALVDALWASARAAGAKALTSAEALHVVQGALHHGVVFRHEGVDHEVEATRVLVNAGPQVFASLLGLPSPSRPEDEGSVLKINMLLRRLPRFRAEGLDPRDAFGGTLHVDEGYAEMGESYTQATRGAIPERIPFEVYCHTLTDGSILSPALREAGNHTLTLFGLDLPYRLFVDDPDGSVKETVVRRSLDGLNRVLAEPIEECLALDAHGVPCIEAKTPVDLERDLALPRGSIFHGALSWFFAETDEEDGAWGVETDFARVYRCGSSARRGGGVSGIPGHNAARRIFAELGVSTPEG